MGRFPKLKYSERQPHVDEFLVMLNLSFKMQENLD